MISKKVPHTYIQEGIRYYALIRECEITTENGTVSAVNFYIFDERGYVWLQMTHTTHSFINQLGNGLLQDRYVLEADDTTWDTRPLVDSTEWIEGVPDRGYALEIIREGLGLNLAYLTALMGDGEKINGGCIE